MKLHTRVHRGVLTLLVVTTALAGAQQARADWREPAGGPSPINADASHNAGSVALATVDGTPHIAWTEDTTQTGQGNSNAIHVARFNSDGSGWTRLAPDSPITRSPTRSTTAPSLADVGGDPWVAWAENADGNLCPNLPFGPNKQIHAARLGASGDEWMAMDDSDNPISRDPGGQANDPTIAGSGGRPYVAFWEFDPGDGSLACPGAEPARVWVMRLSADGGQWQPVGGGPAQIDPASDALFPRMAIVDGRPWVSYYQVAFDNGSPFLEVRVARLSDDGNGWMQVGGPVVETGFGPLEPSAIAGVAGVPTVAVTTAGQGIRVFQPAAGGNGWHQLGSGPVSDQGGGASVADMGGVPWVGFNVGGRARAARLDGGTWRQAGSEIDGAGSQLASVNGFPWAAFVRDDRSQSGGSGPDCCGQARVARLEPTFSGPRAFPVADSATLLSDIDAFGLPYPVGFEYGEGRDGAAIGSTAKKPADGDFVLGEARGLKPASLYWFRPFATAGTPLPLVQGPRDTFATAPASAAPGSSPAPQTTVIAGKARLIVAIVRAPTRVRRGTRVRVRVLSTESGRAEFSVVRHGVVVRRIGRSVRAGTFTIIWRARRAPRLYRLRVRVHASDGRVASDAVTLRVLRRRRS